MRQIAHQRDSHGSEPMSQGFSSFCVGCNQLLWSWPRSLAANPLEIRRWTSRSQIQSKSGIASVLASRCSSALSSVTLLQPLRASIKVSSCGCGIRICVEFKPGHGICLCHGIPWVWLSPAVHQRSPTDALPGLLIRPSACITSTRIPPSRLQARTASSFDR